MAIDLNDLRRRIVDGVPISRDELKAAIAQNFPVREAALSTKPRKKKASTTAVIDLSEFL